MDLDLAENSNPAAPTGEGADNQPLLSFKRQFVPKFVPNQNFQMAEKKKAKATIVDYDGDVSRDWYIDIVLPDLVTKSWKRIRYKGGVNRYKKKIDRDAAIFLLHQQIEKMLAQGLTYTGNRFAFGSLDETVDRKVASYTLQKAILVYYTDKKADLSRSSTNRILALHRLVKEFETGHRSIDFVKVQVQHVQKFLEWVQQTRNLEPKTFNHYRNTLASVYNHFIKMGASITNPVKGITAKRVTKGQRHHPLTMAELSALKKAALDAGDKQYALFIAFAFYTLARPGKELRFLKVGDIDGGRLWIRGENAKTGATRVIDIAKPLRELIHKSGIQDFPADHFIFSRRGYPGTEPLGTSYIYKRQKRYLLAAGIDGSKHDVYCLKHSGAIHAVNHGLSTIDIRNLAGHKSTAQTEEYLVNLGAIRNISDKLDQMPEF